MVKKFQKCIICEDNILEKRHPRYITKSIKHGKWRTCSKKCAKTYARVYNYIKCKERLKNG